MDKRKLEAYSVWAKENLEQQIEVSLRAIGINGDNDIKPMQSNGDVYTIEGSSVSYTKDFFNTRKKVVEMVRTDGFQTVIEETAYTWFNRFIALRFMELHDYLSHGFRVLSNPSGGIEPEILRNLSLVKMDLRLDMEKCSALKEQNKLEELYRYVLLQQCRALEKSIPMLFSENTSAYELLLPTVLLTGESILTKLLEIPEENFLEDVEVIGWLYQYYNSAKKQAVFDALKKNVKISKENIPAATQLFTPDWIVRYMVENSLGRLWMDGHPNTPAKAEWKYYLEEAEQEEAVKAQLEQLRAEKKTLQPEQIRFIDPCMGSGHILVYAFDVLMQIYLSSGYSEKDAAYSIVQNNLWGLDLDKRAYQLACFAVIMKARKYDRRFLSRMENGGVDLKLSHFQDLHVDNPQYLDPTAQKLVQQFKNADTYGSLITIEKVDGLAEYAHNYVPTIDFPIDKLARYIKLHDTLTQEYDVVCTNPPYMGNGGMNALLSDYLKSEYPDSKSDLFACFMERAYSLVKTTGYTSMITMESWMFLSSFESLRTRINTTKTIINMVHMPYLGKGGTPLGINFGTAAVVIQNHRIRNYIAQYEYTVYYETDENGVPFVFPTINERWKTTKQEYFSKIPGSPLAYWLSKVACDIFETTKCFESYATTRAGMITGNNNMFIRLWHEIESIKLGLRNKTRQEAIDSKKKWFPYNKGGDFRKWYGNNEYVVNWENDGFYMRHYTDSSGKIPAHAFNLEYIFKENVTWNALTSYKYSARYTDYGFLYDASGSFADVKTNDIKYILSFLCSIVTHYYLSALNPTLNFQKGNIASLPLVISESKKPVIDALTEENIYDSKADWDSIETSWDFKLHPLLSVIAKNRILFDDIDNIPIAECFDCWAAECEERFTKLKANEEELNRIFIEIYGLQAELTPEVEDKDVTVCRIFNTADDIPEEMKKSRYALTKHDVVVSLISYLVGVVMGRYSLNADGLAYAGGEWDASKYQTYQPDDDGIVPIYPFVGMENGLTAQITKLIKIIFGETAYRDNIDFIADALGRKSSEGSEEALNRYLNNDFYKDHLQTYQKRPIYWMFSSGKQNGFKCLIYMHRYDEDTLARINAKYFLPESTRLKNEMEELAVSVTTAEGKEKVRLEKKRQAVAAQYQEAIEYGQVLDHMANKYIKIDLDDGVKVNYAKFQGIELVTDSGTKVKKDLLVPIK